MMTFPKFTEPYNHKLDTRMVIQSNLYRDKYINYVDSVLVYDGRKEPCNAEQEDVLNSRDVYNLWIREGLSLTTVKQACNIFNVSLDADKLDYIKDFLDSVSAESFFDKACKIYLQFVRKGLFGIYSTKFAILALNSIFVRNKVLPIIVYTSYAAMLSELIESGLMLDSFQDMIVQNFEISKRFNTKHKIIPQSEIIETLLEIEQEVRTLFKVKKLDIMGSYARNQATEYSDLDVIVDFIDDGQEAGLKAFLEERIGVPIDVINADDKFAQCHENVVYRLEVF